MVDIRNMFGQHSKKENIKNTKSKKIVPASSSDEEPIFVADTRSKSRRQIAQLLSDEEIIVPQAHTPKRKKSSGETTSHLYEKISKFGSNESHQEIDPADYFSSRTIETNFPEQKKKRKRNEMEDFVIKDSESILSDSPHKSPKRRPTNPPVVEETTLPKSNIPKFLQALQREPPKMLGQRPLPTGAYNCLQDLTFVITGILEYFEREEISSLVQRYGGRITTNVSGRTSYLVVGREPGETKLRKAKEIGTEILNEDQFYKLISDTGLSETPKPITQSKPKSPKKKSIIPTSIPKNESELWVDKYKPTTVDQIIGQHGPKSPAHKLVRWLQEWQQNRLTKSKKNFFEAKEDGSLFRAALLSGPPGIGKSTAAKIVCQQLNYDIVEMNASDTRSKKSMENLLSISMQNFRITDEAKEKKSVLIMDEVDGMSGNEDRGGVQELISMIKSTRFPIICICNDRMHTKIRSLSNYCYDLRFSRPRLPQIKDYIMEICTAENLEIEPQAAEQIVTASHNDIRLILNNLQMWSVSKRTFMYDDTKKEAKMSEKDVTENIFEVARKLFTISKTSKNSISERSDLFFVDYSIIPLFVFENYTRAVTPETGTKRLMNIARAAQAISDGDICERIIRSTNNWSLLPTQAILSTVIPSELSTGAIVGMINFPQFLGKNSSSNKTNRVVQEMVHHTRIKSRETRSSFILDFIPYASTLMYLPLIKNQESGVEDLIQKIVDYDLTRDDWDSILQLSQLTETTKLAPIPTKVKSNITRTYNKISRQLPYSLTSLSISASKKKSDDIEEEDSETEDTQEEPLNNPMIKVISSTSTPATQKSTKKRATRKIKT